MKKEFETPELEIIVFISGSKNEITTSGDANLDPGMWG